MIWMKAENLHLTLIRMVISISKNGSEIKMKRKEI